MIKTWISYLFVATLSLLLAFCQPVAASTPAWIVEQSRGRVSYDNAETIVNSVVAQSLEQGVDPRLVFKIIWVESRFNKRAISGAGAKGLMQVMSRYHSARYKGENIYSVETNIRVGVEILVEYKNSSKCAGDEVCALRRYYGDKTSNRYPNKIYAVNLPEIPVYVKPIEQPSIEVACQSNDYLDHDIVDCRNS